MKTITLTLISLLASLTTTAAPIKVDIKYLYYNNDDDNYKTLKNGSILYRGKDFLKIIFTPSQRAYVYIFAKGSSGNIYRIFPMRAFKGKIINNFNPVLAGINYHIPKKDKAFKLGGSPGTETIYFITSKHQDIELESKHNRILEKTILTRDFTDITYDPIATKSYTISKAGKKYIVMRDRLLSCDGCVSKISYELR